MRNRSVLAVVAHPDDEILGCGGALAKHINSGDSVAVLIMADGESSRLTDIEQDAAKKIITRQNNALSANLIIGVNQVKLMNFADNRMDGEALLDIVRVIENEINIHGPEIVYTHCSKDVNIDHTLVHEAVVVATRPQPGHPVKTLLFFEVPSSTEWRPGSSRPAFAPEWFADISDSLEQKLKALAAYS